MRGVPTCVLAWRMAICLGAGLLGSAPASPMAGLAAARQPSTPTFASRADLVVVHALVENADGRAVSGLTREAFTIFEDGRPQEIAFFAEEDAPVDVGLIVDGSGSMLTVRDRLIAAAGAFVALSHPDDRMFALVFTERLRSALPPSAPFTADAAVLQAALSSVLRPRGRTALYDAILHGLDYVAAGTHLRKALIVVSDGGDNASVATFDQVLRRTQASNAVIYTVALSDALERGANPGRLRRLADASGGEAFQPSRPEQIEDAMRHIARDIRSSYTLGYAPANAVQDGRLRRIRVSVRSPDGRPLSVRSRQGYVVEVR